MDVCIDAWVFMVAMLGRFLMNVSRKDDRGDVASAVGEIETVVV